MESTRYLTWKANLDLGTCLLCREMSGKIYEAGEIIDPEPPMHPNCRCKIEPLQSLLAGTATKSRTLGADWWLKTYGKLPDYYISRQDAKAAGWIDYLGNLNLVLSGKMISGGIYKNKDGHLPSSPGRVWYEADINYTRGWRGLERILFSNDGLIFVTYDHYGTFYEIV